MPSKFRLALSSQSSEIRTALESHTPWLRSCFTEDISDLVQLRFDHSLASLAAHHLLGDCCRTGIPVKSLRKLEDLLERVEFPPAVTPALALKQVSLPASSRRWSASWLDCPVALYFKGLTGPVIAANIPTVDGMSRGSEWREVTLVLRSDIPALLCIMEAAFTSERKLTVITGEDVEIQPLEWDALVLDEEVVRLIKDDFLLFLKREDWYQAHRLPFRRGYLLHGPPGNGKSSVIRAMLSTPGVSGFTLDPFMAAVDDSFLAMTFSHASQATPALIVLEDLDRCYPVEKEKDQQASFPLQQLLNHLDGVGSQGGIMVVATANNPTILDPAVLRRPGRFDRVVCLGNPSAELRERYIRKMHAPLAAQDISAFVRATAGWSFAQLRECYILAGQFSLDEGGDVDAIRLTRAARTLAETMELADHKWNMQPGFRRA